MRKQRNAPSLLRKAHYHPLKFLFMTVKVKVLEQRPLLLGILRNAGSFSLPTEGNVFNLWPICRAVTPYNYLMPQKLLFYKYKHNLNYLLH